MNKLRFASVLGHSLLAGAMLVAASQASASSFTGTGNYIGIIRVSSEDDGSLRVGVQLPVATACPVDGFFTTTPTQDISVRNAWLKLLQSAKENYQNYHSFSVVGTGTCDAKNVEIIRFVYLN